MTDGNGTTTYSYYAVTNGQIGAGNLQSVDGPWSNDTVTYTYDELGRASNRAINGVGQSMIYDAIGRVTVVTNALGSFTNSYVNTTPRLSSMSYPNRSDGGVQLLRQHKRSTVADYLAQNDHWRHDFKVRLHLRLDGQIATWTQQADNTSVVYTLEYDLVDQLLGTTVKDSATLAVLKQFVYAYDKAGNRTREQLFAGGTNSVGSLTSAASITPIN